jgi:hypothetical protein
MLKFILVLVAAASLAGCATPADVNAMIGTPTVQLIQNSPLKQAVQVNNVSGGQKTNPLWTSQVGDMEFQQALEQSLGIQGVTTGAGAKYRLNAVLVELHQPFAGFDLTVRSTVRYTLMEVATNRVVFDQTITAEFTAGVSDAVLAVQRLKLANEGSIKSNISKFMDQLFSSMGTGGMVQIRTLTLGFVG